MIDDLNTWFKGRPKWLQEAANMLFKKGHLEAGDIDALLDRCLREANLEDAATLASFPANAFHAQNVLPLRLRAIGNVKGINALAPRSPLDFGSGQMAIVYGSNGSGKSGYVRILKHLCGARNLGVLHPNVFAGDGAAQSAEITYILGDQERQLSWSTSDGVQVDLRPADIFDTECGRMYLESESEVTYEPPALQFFSDLIAVCEEIANRIDGELGGCVSRKPQIPAEFADTAAAKWYSSLNAKTSPEEVATHAKWGAEGD